MNLEQFPKKVRIVEVGARDGLQNEKSVIDTADKVEFIKKLADAGHQSIEVTSFVRPDRIAQMSDAKELFPLVKKIIDPDKTQLICLVPNLKGLELASELGVKDVAVFTATSDSFNLKNINATVSQSFDRIEPVIEKALASGMRVRGYVSTAFGCPYEGAMDPRKAGLVAQRLDQMGCHEISIGDTIGTGTPYSVHKVLDEVLKSVSQEKVALHFHDTRGMAVANVMAGLERGIAHYDSSAGGLGGCPYAKGATGNVGTEDLIYLFHTLGIDCGVDLDKQCVSSLYMLEKLEKYTTSKFLQAYLNGKMKIYMPSPKDF
tara:strand:+ start:53848 stop:54801 length:954 start_codon:yes stop_codon:yes gene_type:complete